jgi:hypothetical protein
LGGLASLVQGGGTRERSLGRLHPQRHRERLLALFQPWRNKPQADNKQETISVNQKETFPVRNGQTTGSFTVTPLSTLACPGNQVVVIESITQNLTVSGQGLSAPVVGP